MQKNREAWHFPSGKTRTSLSVTLAQGSGHGEGTPDTTGAKSPCTAVFQTRDPNFMELYSQAEILLIQGQIGPIVTLKVESLTRSDTVSQSIFILGNPDPVSVSSQSGLMS